MKHDVIIIGSGMGGLVCGSLLARAGQSVLVLEQGAQAGGCLQSYKRQAVCYDTGFHYVGGLGEGQSLRAVFDCLGLMQLPWQRLDGDGFDRVTLDGHTYCMAEGFDRFVRRLAEDFPREQQALRQYVKTLQHITPEMASISAWQYLTDTFCDSLLIQVLSGAPMKMELRRETLPLFTFAHGNADFIESSWRLRGDGGQVAAVLTEAIRRDGGAVVCRKKVVELVEREGRIVAAVCADGEVIEGRYFISDIHPAVTCSLLKHSTLMKPLYRRRISTLANTTGMLTVSLRLKPGLLRYFNYNQYVYRTADVWDLSPAGGVMVSCRVPAHGPYTEQVDLLTPMSWAACRPWASTSVGRRGDDYLQQKERMAEACIDLAEQFIPGLRSMTAARYVSTPLTWRHPLTTMLSVRTPVDNLLLTGQSLVMHGLHGVTMTALHTCAEIVGKECINKMIKGKI